MAKARPKVALVEFVLEDIARAIQLLKASQELAASIGYCFLFTWDHTQFNGPCPISALSDILKLCGNLDRLWLVLDANSDLDGPLCAQLCSSMPRGLPNLRHLVFDGRRDVALPEFVQLLQLVPNLQHFNMFPHHGTNRAPAPHRSISAALLGTADLMGSMHFDFLDVLEDYTEAILALLLSHRWTARTLVLRLMYPICMKLLAEYDIGDGTLLDAALPTTDLSIRFGHYGIARTSPGPLSSFIANRCRALKRLELTFRYGQSQDMCAVLHPVLTDAGFRIKELSLQFFVDDHVLQDIRDAVGLLSTFPPGLLALRCLTVSVFGINHSESARLFDNLVKLCRERRIRCVVH